jgi:hypothetical protein
MIDKCMGRIQELCGWIPGRMRLYKVGGARDPVERWGRYMRSGSGFTNMQVIGICGSWRDTMWLEAGLMRSCRDTQMTGFINSDKDKGGGGEVWDRSTGYVYVVWYDMPAAMGWLGWLSGFRASEAGQVGLQA